MNSSPPGHGFIIFQCHLPEVSEVANNSTLVFSVVFRCLSCCRRGPNFCDLGSQQLTPHLFLFLPELLVAGSRDSLHGQCSHFSRCSRTSTHFGSQVYSNSYGKISGILNNPFPRNMPFLSHSEYTRYREHKCNPNKILIDHYLYSYTIP